MRDMSILAGLFAVAASGEALAEPMPQRFDLACVSAKLGPAAPTPFHLAVDLAARKYCLVGWHCSAITEIGGRHFGYDCHTVYPKVPEGQIAVAETCGRSMPHFHVTDDRFTFDWATKQFSRHEKGSQGDIPTRQVDEESKGACTVEAFSGLHRR
jgi:hypothetical protein